MMIPLAVIGLFVSGIPDSMIAGKAPGEPCVFPFLFESKNYTDCTPDGRKDGKPWCGITDDYDRDRLWRFCEWKSCVFPFLFEGKHYTECTTDGVTNGLLWCATTYNYDRDRKWRSCEEKRSPVRTVVIAVIAAGCGLFCVGLVCAGVWMRYHRKGDRNDDMNYGNCPGQGRRSGPSQIPKPYESLNPKTMQPESVYEL